MDESSCYVFKSKRDRPTKRRRLNSQITGGDESRRHATFEHIWRLQEQKVNEAVSATNEKSLGEVVQFLDTAYDLRRQRKIPTILIVTGPTTPISFFDEVQVQATQNNKDVFVPLIPSDASNLKTLLKTIINRVTHQQHDSDNEDEVTSLQSHKTKLLSYDLKLVQDWVEQHGIHHLILNIRRSEAFDVTVFSDLVQLLHSWLDRIPIVLLIGIATSIDVFQERLPQSTIKYMQGESLDVSESSQVMEDVFAICSASSGARLHLGPDFAASLMQRNRDHMPSLEAFTQAVKYAYMCHFHGNPLSVFLHDGVQFHDVDTSLFEAVRNLPSFQRYIEQLIDQKEASLARNLLRSDSHLFEKVMNSCQEAQVDLEWLCGALQIIKSLRIMSSSPAQRISQPFSYRYIKALSGALTTTSPAIRELFLAIRRLPSADLAAVLSEIVDVLMSMPPSNNHDVSPDSFLDMQSELSEMVLGNGDLRAPTTNPGATNGAAVGSSRKTASSIPDPGTPSSQSRTTPSQQYAALLARFHTLLSTYLTATLSKRHYTQSPFVNATPSHTTTAKWFPHEIIMLNTRSLHAGAFTPAPRAAIERALFKPGDYLGEESCRDASHHPATAILYQLYCESGTLINVADLWTAFRARVAPRRDAPLQRAVNGDSDDALANGQTEERQDVEDSDMVIRALFFRALAELKYLGMVKQSRKKADCVQKVLWPGV